MPKSLAEARTKVTWLATAPADPDAVTVTEATAGVDMSCVIVANDFTLGAVDSDRISDQKALCDEGNVSAIGSSNYAAGMSFFRMLDGTGASEATEDVAWETFVGKGITGYFLKRVGPKSKTAWAVGDIYDLFEVVTDNPQDPTERTGYLKFRQPFEVGGLVVLRKALVTGV